MYLTMICDYHAIDALWAINEEIASYAMALQSGFDDMGLLLAIAHRNDAGDYHLRYSKGECKVLCPHFREPQHAFKSEIKNPKSKNSG